MFFNKPAIDSTNLYAEPTPIDPANEAPSLDVFKAYEKEQAVTGNTFSSSVNLGSIYEDHNRKVKELTGEELDNPFYMVVDELDETGRQKFYDDFDTYRKDGGTASTNAFIRRWVEGEYRKKLDAIAQKYPDKRADLIPDQSFVSQSYGRRVQAMDAAQKTWEQSGQDPLDYLGWLGGSAYGALQDPVTWITAPIGFSSGVGLGAKGLAMGFLKTGAANAMIEAPIQLFSVQPEQNRAGLPSGFTEGATAVGGAFLLGGALDLGIRGTFRAVAPQFGFAPVMQDGIVVAWKKPGPTTPTPSAPLVAPEFDPELMKRVAEGDTEAAQQILAQIDKNAKKTGETVIPNALVERAEAGDVEAARGIAETIARDDPYANQALYGADADAVIATAPDPLIAPSEHARVTTQALRAVTDPENEPFPVRVAADPVQPERLPALEAQLAELRAKGNAADAETAQQIASLEAEVQMIARFGRDPIQSAEVLRTNPAMLTADIDPSTPGVKSAVALSKLSDEAFAQVKEGKAAPELGELVSDHVLDPALHSRVLSDLVAMRPSHPIEAKSRLAELLRSPEYNRALEAAEAPKTATNPRQIDDPYGSEAKAQLQGLEQNFKEEMSAGGLAPSIEEAVLTPEGQALSVSRAAEVDGVIEEFTGVKPATTTIQRFDAIDDLPPTLRAKVRQGNAIRFGEQLKRFQEAKSEVERLAIRKELDAAAKGEGIEGIADGDTIWIAAFAQNPRAKIAHEVVHSLKRTGQLRPDEEAILATAARDAGVFSKEREALYREAYAGRSNVDELIAEEAAAHYMEAFVRGDIPAAVPVNRKAATIVERIFEFAAKVREALGMKGFRAAATDTPVDPARDVVAAILNGEVAKREITVTQAATSNRAKIAEARTAVDAARAEVARLEATEPIYADPQSGMKMSRAEINAIVEQWKYVREVKSRKPPQRLIQYVRELGGILDDQGDVRHNMGGARSLPGMVNKNGQTLDDAALNAWQAGFLPGAERPTINEFLDALDRDQRGDYVVRATDIEALDDIRIADEMANDLSELGVYNARTEKDVVAAFTPSRGSGKGGGKAATGGPSSARLDAAREALRKAEADLDGLASSKFAMRDDLDQSPEARKARAEAMGFDTSRVFYHGTGSDIEGFSLRKAQDKEGRRRGLGLGKGKVYLTASPESAGKWALQAPERGLGQAPNVMPLYVRGPLIDETAWTNKFTELSGGEPPFSSTLDMATRDKLIAETDAWAKAQGFKGIQQVYRHNETGDVMSVGQVAVFNPKDMRSVNAEFDPAMSDSPNLMYAFSDAETGRSMARDLDSLGYYSGALMAAQSLKQDKGTPEQMLAMLRKAGAKEAELEATGLVKFIGSRESAASGSDLTVNETPSQPNWEKWGARVSAPETVFDSTSLKILDADGTPTSAGLFVRDTPEAYYIDGIRGSGKLTKNQGQASRAVKAIVEYAMAKGKPVIATKTEGARSYWNILGFRHDGINSVLDAEQFAKLKTGEINSTIWGHERGYGKMFEDKYGPGASELAQSNVDRSSVPAGSAKRMNQITKSEIIDYLEQNKVQVKEANYGTDPAYAALEKERDQIVTKLETFSQRELTRGLFGAIADDFRTKPLERRLAEIDQQMAAMKPPVTRWSAYSLDPSNPTYRETVLHLPARVEDTPTWKVVKSEAEYFHTRGEYLDEATARANMQPGDTIKRVENRLDKSFQSGHFSEPNIIGHMMTSMTKHEGKPVYTLDQIQSDWGQKLRDGGVRDEAKIADLKSRRIEVEREAKIKMREQVRPKIAEIEQEIAKRGLPVSQTIIPKGQANDTASPILQMNYIKTWLANNTDNDLAFRVSALTDVVARDISDLRMLEAELRTAEAATPGNPLVNTTDQWLNTTLRRALRQAIEAKAEYIAIPHGDTVLSYNPGDEAGMRGFYGSRTSEGIVPKNLRKLLQKLDKDTPAPERIDTLDSPSGKTGLGKGFTLFKLTDKTKQSVMTEGQPLFAMRDSHDTAHVTATDKGAGQYLSAKVGHPGYGYTASGEAMLVTAEPARMMDWQGTGQTPEVRRALDAVAAEHGLKLSGKSGKSAYRALSEKLGSDDKATEALRAAGIQGHKATAGQFENSVIFDPELVKPDPMTPGSAAPEADPGTDSGLADQLRDLLDPDALARVADEIDINDPAQAMALVERFTPMLRQYGIEPLDAMPILQRAMAGEDPQALLPDLMAMAPEIDNAIIQQGIDAAGGLTADPSPMFAMRDDSGKIKRGAERRAKALATDVQQIEADLATAAIDQREALQRKRAVFLNAKSEDAGLDDVIKYRSARGQEDLAAGFLRMHESFGKNNAPFADVASLRQDIAKQALGKMADVMWELRKGALLGDLRRVKNAKVRTRMENMIREAAGEKTSDPVAARMAKAWLDTAEWLRQSFNAAGGDIQKLNGWFAPQYHDAELLLAAGRKTWVARMMQDGVLDRAKMLKRDGAQMTDAELRDMLSDIWSTITTDGANKRDVTDSFGKGALYKRHAEHRVLHFKDADAFMDYAREFGRSDPYSMMLGHINMMARDIASLRRFGANPELVRERLKQHILMEAKEARSARSVFDDLSDTVSDLKSQLAAIVTPAEKAMAKMAEIHERLDKIAGKPRYKAERETLRAELFKVHEELSNAMAATATTPEQKALTAEIAGLLDEIDQLSETQPVLDRNPEQRARRIIARADEMWKLYNGSTNVPTDGQLAGGMSAFRNWTSASVLAAASLSSITDQATGLAARAFIGMPVTRQLASFVKGFTKSDRQFALRAQVGLDQAMNAFAVSTRFMGFANTAHITGYLTDRTHSFSGLAAMTQASKIAFASDFMSWMADLSSKSYASLPSWTRDMMNRHGFTEADFNALKLVTPETHRGVAVLTRPAIERDAGEDVAERYMRMLIREQSMAVLEPTLQGRTAFISETKPGTVVGEIARSTAMLKSFPASYTMLVLGRFYDAHLQGKGLDGNTIAAAAAIFGVGTLLGAMAMQMKSLAKGQDPQPMDNNEFWQRAFMQSGGVGIFGDFIANSTNRFGNGLAGTLMGPMPQAAGTILDATVGNVFQYAKDEPTNAGREGVNFLRRMTPGAFVPFYLRAAYERMLLDELQQMVDPEAHKVFRRRRQNLKKSSGNDFYWPPGQSQPDRGPNFGSVVSQ